MPNPAMKDQRAAAELLRREAKPAAPAPTRRAAPRPAMQERRAGTAATMDLDARQPVPQANPAGAPFMGAPNFAPAQPNIDIAGGLTGPHLATAATRLAGRQRKISDLLA